MVLTSQAAAAADPAKKGETMGILSALMSAYMVMAPVLSGYIYEIHHSGPYVLSSLLLLLGVYFALLFKKRRAVGKIKVHAGINETKVDALVDT